MKTVPASIYRSRSGFSVFYSAQKSLFGRMNIMKTCLARVILFCFVCYYSIFEKMFSVYFYHLTEQLL